MLDCKKEIQELKAELLRAQKEIETLSRIKSDFVSVISHELRTPLTSIKESVSLILDGAIGPVTENQKKFLIIAKNNIDRLAGIITDMFDLSRLEAGRIALSRKKLDINDVIKEAYSSTKALAERKNINFTISQAGEPLFTWLDPDRIIHVLKSLITNAVKFNKENGAIAISASKEDLCGRMFIKVVVEDTGIGIPQEEIKNLFNNFTPLDTSMTRKYGGAGLGLVISKGIVKLHGGDIWVISEPGVGSKFIFTLPTYSRHEEFNFLVEEAIERARRNDNKISLIVFDVKNIADRSEGVIAEIEEAMKNTVRGPEDKITRCKEGECIVIIACTDRPGAMAIIKRLKAGIKAPLVFGISVYPDDGADREDLTKKAWEDLKSGTNAEVSQKLILIIDDEEDLASMLSFRLRGIGFNTVTANGGEEGLELAKKSKPDLILLDLLMPRMNGFETYKRLKADHAIKDIPVVVFSAFGSKDTKESIEKLGAAGFIEKPFDPEILIDKIEDILEVKNG